MSTYRTVTAAPVISQSKIEVTPQISENQINVAAAVITPVYSREVEYYDGQYEFEPSNNAQIIQIKKLMAAADIIINPIPSNYGLITWSGAGIRVS